MFLIWVRQSDYGMEVGPDAAQYISLAESLTRGEGFISWDGRASVANLLPLTLSIIISLGFANKLSAAAYLNIVAFGLSVFVLIVWLFLKTRSRFIILCMGIACAISPLLGQVHARVLTEPLSVLFVVTSLFALDKFLDSSKGYWVILAAVSAALNFLTHYTGTFLIISTLIILATCLSSRRIKYIVVYLSVTTPAVGVYLLQNFVRIRQIIPQQWGPPFSHLSSIDTLTSEFIKWVFRDTGFAYFETISENFNINRMLVRFIILVALFIALSLSLWFGGGLRSMSQKRLMEFRKLATPLVFILVYISATYISLAFSGRNGPYVARFLVPVYAPFLIIFAVLLDRVRKVYVIFVAMFMSLWLISGATTSYNDIENRRDYGFGYLSEDWAGSETIDYLNSNPVAGLVYSNQIRAVYINSRIPDRDGIYFRLLPSELPQDDFTLWTTDRTQNVDLQNIDMYVIWFNDGKAHRTSPRHYDLTSLMSSQNLEVVAVLEDGIVLRRNQGSSRYFEDSEAAVLGSILKDAWLIFSNTTVDLYSNGERFIYVATLCSNIDIESGFFLHIYPNNRADRWNSDLDFNNYDFSFSREGIFWGEGCAVIRNLPDYKYQEIRTGQFTANEGELWVEELQPELLYQQRIS